jgi:hypothetical protein
VTWSTANVANLFQLPIHVDFDRNTDEIVVRSGIRVWVIPGLAFRRGRVTAENVDQYEQADAP